MIAVKILSYDYLNTDNNKNHKLSSKLSMTSTLSTHQLKVILMVIIVTIIIIYTYFIIH